MSEDRLRPHGAEPSGLPEADALAAPSRENLGQEVSTRLYSSKCLQVKNIAGLAKSEVPKRPSNRQ